MVLTCKEVCLEISNYIDNDVDPQLRVAMDDHFSQCPRCKAVLDGARNVISLYSDERMLAPSLDFHRRLHGRLADYVEGPKGSWWGWGLAAGIAAAVAMSFLLGALRGGFEPSLRAEMSQPARQIKQQLVAVVANGKVFHVPGCPFFHGKYRMITPEEAIREGYTPCTRCLGEDLKSAQRLNPDTDSGHESDRQSDHESASERDNSH
jgi:hypothetical protein